MSYAEDFVNLERANAQIDIWIDEEEYDKVIDSCVIDKDLKINEEDRTLYNVLEAAFDHPFCTDEKDDEWLSILNHSTCPIFAIRNIPLIPQPIDLTSKDYAPWSHFFWAKLIRARIQQKGTDCYFRRLDQVVAYLERHSPTVSPLNQKQKDKKERAVLLNKLAVIYFLEMAASGQGADQRSFAERARRILQEHINDKDFKWFYELLARYNIGIGYFHERLYRKAVLEFNLIISKFDEVEEKSYQRFAPNRLGEALLYFPAVLYRAEVQLKLQLAYHAFKTLAPYLTNLSKYKLSKNFLAIAEAYQQMNNKEKIYKPFEEIAEMLEVDLGYSSQITENPVQAENKYQNLMGKLRGLLASYYLQYLIKNEQSTALSEEGKLREYLKCLNRFFAAYKESSRYQRTEREGYLRQLAEYLTWLVQKGKQTDKENNIKNGKNIFWEEADKIYSDIENDTGRRNDEMLNFDEDKIKDCSCPCEEKGIDLRRLNAELHNAFSDNMRKFYEVMAYMVAREKYKELKKNFLRRLEKREKNDRYDLNWRLRDLELEAQESPPGNWCKSCLPFVPKGCPVHFFREKAGFNGLLSCVGAPKKESMGKLLADDYEQIMDHWDEHFLEHMKDRSFHEPRCRAIHFLGLQRWNSSSPAQGRSLGGGYLIYYTDDNGRIDLGIAIDPGFDFVRNLFHVGFSLADIDVVLLSHAHVDHVRDFESMVTLLSELRKRTKNANKEIKRKLHAIMTLGVYRRLEYLFDNPRLREFIEPYILDIEKEIDAEFLDKCKFEFIQAEDQSDKSDKAEPSKKPNLVRFVPVLPGENGEESSRDSRIHLTIAPTKAYHDDFSEYSDSFGFILTIKDPKAESQPHYIFGYTGDTSWSDDIMKQYKECGSLIVHLGSLIDREKKKEFKDYKSAETCFELIREKNHPYLMGMLHFLTQLFEIKPKNEKPLILMSEFGEELRGGIRLDFVDRLKKTYGLDILPVDVGLDVLLACDSSNECKDRSTSNGTDGNPKVWCVQCKHFVALDDAAFIHYGHDEALFCVCKTCKKATPVNVLQERLRALYEVGRRLQIH